MASSGTVGATVFRVADLIDTVARRCGVTPDRLTPEGIDVLTGVLWRILAHMSNRGINLWRVYKALYPMYQGQQDYSLARGDINILRMMHRQPLPAAASSVTSSSGGTTANLTDRNLNTACLQSAPNGNLVFDWGSGNLLQINTLGINSAAAMALNLVFEISNDGIAWTQVSAPGSVTYTQGMWQWYELEPPGVPARYFRVRETGGATLNLAEVVLAPAFIDVEIASLNRDQWTVWPNKRSQGTPRQYYFDRQITPKYSLTLVPNAGETFYCVANWIHRHIEDVGAMVNTLDIPERWYQPIIDVTSWSALPELPGADLSRSEMLKDAALAVTLPDAEKEEEQKGPVQLVPQIGVYTR